LRRRSAVCLRHVDGRPTVWNHLRNIGALRQQLSGSVIGGNSWPLDYVILYEIVDGLGISITVTGWINPQRILFGSLASNMLVVGRTIFEMLLQIRKELALERLLMVLSSGDGQN
jgi:hypothetical protein